MDLKKGGNMIPPPPKINFVKTPPHSPKVMAKLPPAFRGLTQTVNSFWGMYEELSEPLQKRFQIEVYLL